MVRDEGYIAMFSGVAALVLAFFYSLGSLVIILHQSANELLAGIAGIIGIVQKIGNFR